MNFTRAAITRPVFVLMLMLAAVVIGYISYNSMRVELNPEVSFGVVTVSTAYPGAGPEEINNLISRKVEDAVSGVNGIREITATSREGLSVVVISLELSVNADVALNDVRSKVDGITGNLPKDALKPQVTKFDTSSTPELTLSINSTLPSRELRDLVDKKIKDRFAQIQGVASADLIGGDIREFQVQISKDKLLQYGIGIADIQRVLQAATLNAPAGKLINGNQEYSVRVNGEFHSVDDIKNVVFNVVDPRSPSAHHQIKLTDVATISDTSSERTSFARLNGKEALVLNISKTKEGNAVEITKAADAIIDQLVKEDQYKAIQLGFTKTLENAKQITESLDDVKFAIAFGIFLVCVIVYIFLHDWRGTLIVGTAIPTCIFATFIALKGMGFTINNLSMLSLSLAVGVLVDDAIVVLENIYRHLRRGEDPKDAALNGRGEIGLAAIAITMADVVVFTPIGFMGGIVGQFFKPMALGFVAAVLFSLLVSFSLTPMLASRWYRAGEDLEHPTGRFAVWFEKVFHNFENRYRRVLEWCLNHRWYVFAIGNLALFGTFAFIAGGFTGLGGLNPKVGLAGAVIPTLIPMTVGCLVVGALLGLLASVIKGLKGSSIQLRVAGIACAVLPLLLFLGGLKPAMAFYPLFLVIWTIVAILRGKVSIKPVIAGAIVLLIIPFSFFTGSIFGYWKKEAVFKFSFLPSADSGTVNVSIEMPPGTNLDATTEVVKTLEKRIDGTADVKYVLSTIGSQGGGGFGGPGSSGSNFAQITISLIDKAAPSDMLHGNMEFDPKTNTNIHMRTRSATEVASEVLNKVGRIPGAFIKVSAADAFGFGSAIQMSFTSDDRAKLTQAVTKVKEALQAGVIPGVINPDISSKPGKPEIQAIPDRQLMADAGLSVAELAGSARILYEGNTDTKLRINGDEYDVRVMVDRKDRDDPNLIQEMPVKFVGGLPIFLGSVTQLNQKPALDKIDRRNRVEEVRVTADLLPGFAAGSVQQQIDQWIQKNNIATEGVLYKPLGQADAQAREGQYMIQAFFLGLLLVYMLLASLFDNIIYPFIIQLAQPQALVGALLALVITDKAFSLIGFIGLVSLIGLVGKNAILIVDYTNTLRHRGKDRHDALVEAAPTRLRPIMMTTLALVLGTLPVALAIGRGSEFRETIGITIIGGISLSTFLTLLLIPCSYTLFDDFSDSFGNFMRDLREMIGMEKGAEVPQPVVEPRPAKRSAATAEPETI